MKAGAIEVLSNKLVLIYIVVLTLGFSQLFAAISTTQQIYDITYGKAESFPSWFALTAILALTGTILNAMLVMRVGMRKLAIISYLIQAILSSQGPDGAWPRHPWVTGGGTPPPLWGSSAVSTALALEALSVGRDTPGPRQG